MLFKALTLLPLALMLSAHPAAAFTLTSTQLIEDFSTDDFADYVATTGLWNLAGPCSGSGGCAQAAVVANAAISGTTRPITFGDGSDGALTSTTGATFDTNAHPNGYNFKSVSITGGAITVTGSNPLVIRSLTTATITPTLAVNGAVGSNGSTVSNSGGTGGAALTCSATGGAGGNATAVTGSNGTDGSQSDGTDEAATAGTLQNGGVTTGNGAIQGQTPTDGPASNDFDTAAANFICGAGGGGGGGFSTTAVNFATGAGGGAGGGRMRVVAVGNLTVNAAQANGGNGGVGPQVAANTCGGDGSGGNGGAVWLQTFNTLSTVSDPTEAFGTGGVDTCGTSGSNGLQAGFARGDSATGAPAWATPGVGGNFDTSKAAASTSYIVQSKAYDLHTASVVFAAPTVSAVTNGGSAVVAYAGSADGSTFSGFSTNLSTLNSQGYRYLKFQVTIVTANPAAASPFVNNIALTFSDAGGAAGAATGPSSLALALSGGCGAIKHVGMGSPGSRVDKKPPEPRALALALLPWLALFVLAHQWLRRDSLTARWFEAPRVET